jgi:hypothetical protein
MCDNVITVVGSAYFQPILDLSERLVQRPRERVTASRINQRENGYSLSIVLLSVVMLESFVGRISDLQQRLGQRGKGKANRRSVPTYIASLRKTFTLEKSLTEVFVLRDAIAHGHVWSLEVSTNERNGQVLRSAVLGTQYGNEQHKKRVHPTTRRTRALGLHVVPSAVGRQEVIKVLDVIHRVLKFLAKSRLIEPNVFSYHGRFQGRPIEFWSVIGTLRCSA